MQPWPSRDDPELHQRAPADWLDPQTGTVRQRLRDRLPTPVTLTTGGRVSPTGLSGHFIPAPFRFCLSCGVAYGATQRADFGKLSSLGSGGRSTSTTVLGLSAVRQLRGDTQLDREARKLLSFCDNRQDASLQAGHFNDFVEIGLLRSGLAREVTAAGGSALTHDRLAQAVFDELHLDPGIVDLLAAKATGGCRVRILTSSPDSGHLLLVDAEQNSRLTPMDVPQLSQDAERTQALLRPILERPQVEARTFVAARYNSILRVDEQMLVTLHLFGTAADQAPLLHLLAAARRGSSSSSPPTTTPSGTKPPHR